MRKSKSFKRSKYDDFEFVDEHVKKFDHRRRKRKVKKQMQFEVEDNADIQRPEQKNRKV